MSRTSAAPDPTMFLTQHPWLENVRVQHILLHLAVLTSERVTGFPDPGRFFPR